MSRNGLRSATSTQPGPKRASTVSMGTAWRRRACSPPLPNSSRPTARRRRRVSPRVLPGASATANSPSPWRGNRPSAARWLGLGAERAPRLAARLALRPLATDSVLLIDWRRSSFGRRRMLLRIGLRLLLLALAAGGSVVAPTNLRGEAAKPPDASAPAPVEPSQGSADKGKGHLAPASFVPEIITDLSRLPAPVARTRERLLAAARSGDLQQLAALMNDSMPIFSFTDDKDPVAFWKTNYPVSDGIEVLSILTMILEAGYVRVDEGTPQEMYVWPYFVRMSLSALTPQQKVELFRIVTGADYKDMMKLGVYAFYRL